MVKTQGGWRLAFGGCTQFFFRQWEVGGCHCLCPLQSGGKFYLYLCIYVYICRRLFFPPSASNTRAGPAAETSTGSWWRLAVGGGWRLAVGAWWSPGAVLKGCPKQKKKSS